MHWVFSLFCFFAFDIFAKDKYIPAGIVIPKDVSSKMDLDVILDRIAEIDAETKLRGLIDTVIVDKESQVLRKRKVIIIDAGHGGKDQGATGIMGTIEKDLVLEYALLLKSILKSFGYTVFLTRNNDSYLTLVERRKFAQNYNGSLMIALHADSATSIEARGLSVYTLSEEASDSAAEMLAQGHNDQNDIIFHTKAKDKFIKSTLIDVVQNVTISKSEHFAKTLVKNCQANRLFTIARPHRQAGFAVLKMPDVPSVLVELGFLSSPEEEILLRSPAYRQQIVQTVAQTVDEFFGIDKKRI
jgi:N-acetylmuramoyl-L-alanine amidase